MEENDLIERLKSGDEKAFSSLFITYYKNLVLFCGNYIPDQVVCEDIVQSVFLRIWKDREKLNITTSVKSFLLKSVQNGCLDTIKHQNLVDAYALSTRIQHRIDYSDVENYVLYTDLLNHLDKAIAQLPEPYRTTFELSHRSGMKYSEIASRLNVSERTVEVRMSKATTILRKRLKEFITVVILILFLK